MRIWHVVELPCLCVEPRGQRVDDRCPTLGANACCREAFEVIAALGARKVVADGGRRHARLEGTAVVGQVWRRFVKGRHQYAWFAACARVDPNALSVR